MSDNLKFRAIIPDKNINKIFTLRDFIKPVFSMHEFVIPWILAGNIPDRFTGFYDASGKEIYSGDIIEGAWDRLLYVILFDTFVVTDVYDIGETEVTGWYQQQIENKYTYPLDWTVKNCLLIGNIHQNPELLVNPHKSA